MAEPASAYAYRPEEPQCYNCGAKGHWAVACPEPTRVTPAGLAAWKSSSSASHGNHRNQHGGSRRGNKGPIITKYAHPPLPVGHGLNQYPPPPPSAPPPPLQSLPLLPPPTPPTPTPLPGHHQAPCQPYPGPTPAYQPHPPPYHHYPSPSPYPPSYHQPGYLPPHPLPHAPPHPPHPPPHYAPPPVHYGVPHVAPSGYPNHPPGPSGPQVPVPQMTVSYPPAYSPYPPARPPDPMSYGQPPTYHPPAYPQLPAYGSQPAPYPSPVASGPIPGPGPAPISPPIVQIHKPPAASQLPSQSIHHSLPPKPPRSRHLNPEPQREHRHKKRYDRQNRNRDNRQKDQPYAKRQGGKKQPPAQAKPSVSLTGNSVKSQPTGMHEKENVSVEKSPKKSPPLPRKDESRNEDGDCEEARAEDEPQPRDSEEREAEADSDEDWEWDLKFIFREPEAAHNPDEVGVPLPEMYCEDALLPRPFTMVCIESKFVTPENVEEFTKPIREQAYWHVIKFDPAFVKDGRLAGGEPLPTQKPHGKTPDPPSKTTTEGHADEEDRAARGRKRKEGWAERAERVEQDRRHHKKSKMVEEGGEQKLPDPTASPSRSRQRRRRSNGSKGSRNSSVTSRSSDLNSLEAELLGRPTRRSPSDGDARHRQTPSKPKRRRRPADSAYGRRW